MTVSEWADEHRALDPLFSSEPGPWRTARVPYAREWMDSASLPWVRRVTLCASTQVGKTEAMNNIAGYFLHQQPSPIMLVLPNRDAARLAAERRIIPMVRSSEALTAEMTERSHDLKNREMAFRRCVLYLRSAQSPSDLASVPVRVVLGDELGKWPKWSGREANPLKLVTERTRTYYDHLIVLGSTPTTRDGLISIAHEQGDRRRYFVPCPHCGEFQALTWAQVKWDREAITTAQEMERKQAAHYECIACNKAIDDRQKRTMIGLGVWVPHGRDVREWMSGGQKADREPHRSYHIWAAYSPWVTWWKIAREFLESKDEANLMMNFVNSWLAEVWEDRVEDTSDATIAACVEPRLMGDVPEQVQCLTAAVDVQKDYLAWAIWGWGLDEESWVIAAGNSKTFDETGDILFRNVWGKRQMPVRLAVIDSRHRRSEVIDWVRRWQPVARMIAGVERQSAVPFSTVRIDKHPRTGLVLPNSMTIWTVNVGMFKDMVAARFAKALLESNEEGAGRIHLPSDLPEDFVRHLSSEHKVRERSGSQERMRWVKKPGHQRNEGWDLAVYNAAAGRMYRVDSMRSPQNSQGFVPRQPAPQRHPQRQRRPDRFPRLGGMP